MLVATDPFGSITATSLQSHEFEKHHMITNPDSNILVAGYLDGLTDGFSQLVVMKFDQSLTPIWSRTIPIIPRYNPYSTLNPYSLEGIGIDAIVQQTGEEYYVTFIQPREPGFDLKK